MPHLCAGKRGDSPPLELLLSPTTPGVWVSCEDAFPVYSSPGCRSRGGLRLVSCGRVLQQCHLSWQWPWQWQWLWQQPAIGPSLPLRCHGPWCWDAGLYVWGQHGSQVGSQVPQETGRALSLRNGMEGNADRNLCGPRWDSAPRAVGQAVELSEARAHGPDCPHRAFCSPSVPLCAWW